MVTKATFGLPEEAVQYLRSEATRRGVSMADVVRQAIATDKYVRSKAQDGADVLIAEKGQATSRLVLP